jgi:hypothetical protein
MASVRLSCEEEVMEIMRAISFFTSVGATAVILFLVTWAIISPRGWTKKDNYGVAVRFKVFLPLYLQNPNKWKLMPDKVMYDNVMTVYFSSGHQWRKYNRWRKRAEKERMKRQQEEQKQRFMDLIFKDYQTEPNPEFTPTPTVKQKSNKDKLTNADLDKIRADLELTENIYQPTDPEELKAEIKRWIDSKELGINPMELAVNAAIEKYRAKKPNHRFKDCKHLMLVSNGNNIRELCGKHRTGNGFERVWSTMVACGYFEPKVKYQDPLETVQKYPLTTTEHYE